MKKQGIIVAAAVLLLTGCKTVYVPVETVLKDTIYISKKVTDSVWVERLTHDSIYIHEKGDTVMVEKWHTEYRDRWRDRLLTDTVYQYKCDTIREVFTNEVEKPLTWWQQTRMDIGGWAIVALIILAGILLRSWWLKIRRRRDL
jgi:hypothetical protein